MKRDSTTLQDIAQWHWLAECAARAARGKRHRLSVQRYFSSFESSTSVLLRSLLAAQLPVQRYRCFTINDPKPRLIHAAPFPDRVAHHAIIGKLAARFERAQVDSSYACRPGKGAHSAIERARQIAVCSPWLLKMDVHSYFANIDHSILRLLLARLFKNKGVLSLLSNVIDSFSTVPGRGLPIGALTSQYFANHYLDGVQRFIRCQTSATCELRYMDDLWVGCESKQHAGKICRDVNGWLQQHRKLSLKPALIQRSTVGLPFCGFTVSSKRLVPGVRRRRAVRNHYRRLAHSYACGSINELQLQALVCSTAALLKPGVHSKLARKLVNTSGLNQLC